MTAATDRAVPASEAPVEPTGRGDLLAGAPITRRDVAVAAVLGLMTVVVGIIWRSPIVPTDPWHYVRSALEFPSDDWVPLGFTRYGIILANIPPAFIFKNAEASYYFWPLLSAGVLAAMLYLIGRRLWSPIAGLVAVVVTFTNTIVFFNLSRGYPDIMSIALVFSALFCALMARDRNLTGKAGVAWILATGFLLGWGFEVRETALLAWPIVLVVLWRRGTVLRTAALLMLPLLGWAALDVGLSGLLYGDPLLKAHTLTGTNPQQVGNVPPPPPITVDLADRTRIGYFLSIPKAALARPDGLWLVVSGALAVLAILVPNRGLRLASLGFISVYSLNLLAGGVLFPQRPFGTLINPRYWIQYFPFIALVIGGLVIGHRGLDPQPGGLGIAGDPSGGGGGRGRRGVPDTRVAGRALRARTCRPSRSTAATPCRSCEPTSTARTSTSTRCGPTGRQSGCSRPTSARPSAARRCGPAPPAASPAPGSPARGMPCCSTAPAARRATTAGRR